VRPYTDLLSASWRTAASPIQAFATISPLRDGDYLSAVLRALDAHSKIEMLDRYERERLPTLSVRTRAGYHRHLKHLREQFGGKDVRAITRLEVKDFAIVPHGKIHRLKAIAVFRNAFAHAN